jgi:RimJ/RimL family protein N-acetyltransferase
MIKNNKIKTKNSEITITNQDGEIFELTVKKIFNLSDAELQNLIAKLSDEEEFKNSEGRGIFYKNSTATNPLTFKDSGLLEDIKNYKNQCGSNDDDLLLSYVLFSNYKNDCKIVGYASFYFYDGNVEPDVIIFKDFREKKIGLAIATYLIIETLHEICERGRLNEYKRLYATVHPENLASIKLLQKLDFTFKEFIEDETQQFAINYEDFVALNLLYKTSSNQIYEEARGCESIKYKIFFKPTKSIINSNKLLLVEIQDNLKKPNRNMKDKEKYRLRLIATNENNLPELLKKLTAILEQCNSIIYHDERHNKKRLLFQKYFEILWL